MTSKALLLHQLDTAFDTKAWHGPTLKGVLRGVDVEMASWRPAADRHTIWELMIHCAYWKYTVRRRILDEKRGAFPLDGSNWFVRPEKDASWKDELNLLYETHRSLREAVEKLSSSKLDTIPEGSSHSFTELIAGVAAHDLYHAGQIQLMKRLAAERRLASYAGMKGLN
ncbi:MAG: DinB family protein [Rubricoccaceae bacterium]|nr:DinB family protein [Rubricoccaceae bacterium]